MIASFPIDINSASIEVKILANPKYINDFDGDKILNESDNCKYVANPDQKDSDWDSI
jgi:hypothetical protein